MVIRVHGIRLVRLLSERWLYGTASLVERKKKRATSRSLSPAATSLPHSGEQGRNRLELLQFAADILLGLTKSLLKATQ